MFLLSNKKNIDNFWWKKALYQELCTVKEIFDRDFCIKYVSLGHMGHIKQNAQIQILLCINKVPSRPLLPFIHPVVDNNSVSGQ